MIILQRNLEGTHGRSEQGLHRRHPLKAPASLIRRQGSESENLVPAMAYAEQHQLAGRPLVHVAQSGVSIHDSLMLQDATGD